MSGTIRSASLANYVETARQVGVDPFSILRRFGIDASALKDGEMRLPTNRVAALLEATAEASGCPDFGLRMADQRRVSDLGVVGLLVSHQRTARDALDIMMRYRDLLNSALALHVEEAGEVSIVREELVIEFDAPKVQSYELAVGIMSRLFHSILGPRWRPVSVHFTHARPKNLALHRKLFGEHIEFDNDFNGLTCLTADLHRPNVSADPKLAQYAAQFVDSMHEAQGSSVAHEVRMSIYLLLPTGNASMPRIARGLGLHERTLQRRLAADGVEFSDLLNGIRRELAERYLVNRSYSLTRIAEMLGYGQLSSFTRWFVGEFGVAPGVWRSQDRSSAPGAARQ
jgi:AraC-like DNA-binding protein